MFEDSRCQRIGGKKGFCFFFASKVREFHQLRAFSCDVMKFSHPGSQTCFPSIRVLVAEHDIIKFRICLCQSWDSKLDCVPF